MRGKNTWQRAQSMAEYAVIIAVVAAALTGIGVFFKGAVQRKFLDLSKQLDGRPYAPRETTSSSTSQATTSSTESYQQGVFNVTYSETTDRSGSEEVRYETE